MNKDGSTANPAAWPRVGRGVHVLHAQRCSSSNSLGPACTCSHHQPTKRAANKFFISRRQTVQHASHVHVSSVLSLSRLVCVFACYKVCVLFRLRLLACHARVNLMSITSTRLLHAPVITLMSFAVPATRAYGARNSHLLTPW